MNFTQAPLPFQGQKRKFLRSFKEGLKSYSSTATYVDLFGGSGLLSHTVKQMYPDAKVIYNDFDNYSERVANVRKTNALLSDIREITKSQTNRKERLSDEIHSKIIARIEKEKGFVDWITVSSNLLFSMNYATSFDELKKEKFYNKVRLSDYNTEGYLEGVEKVRKDYKELYNDYCKYDNVVFLVDPPYLSTDVSTYSKKDYWKLSDYLDVLNVLKDKPYFYFTSNKSQIVELTDWIGNNTNAVNPFAGAKMEVVSTSMNYNSNYQDIMIYKHE